MFRRVLIVLLATVLTLFGSLAFAQNADENAASGSTQPAAAKTMVTGIFSGAESRCFEVPLDTTLILDYDGQFITGTAVDPNCGTGVVLGDIIGGKWTFVRDWPTGDTCPESVWYTGGSLSDLNYEWINSDGARGTGTMVPVPCP